jgi:hypothetical protein
MRPDGPAEERILYRQRFRGPQFRGKIVFTRFDGCKFVECTLLIDKPKKRPSHKMKCYLHIELEEIPK